MNFLDVRVSIKDLHDITEIPTSSKLKDKRYFNSIVRDYCEYLRSLYLSMIEDAIYSRRYKGQWEPVDDPAYIEYIGTTPLVNIYFLIEEALMIKRAGYNFYIYIDKNFKYPNSDMTLLDVLRAIEYGTSKFNARPILRKLHKELEFRVLDLWKGYLAVKGVL